jgi:hypothetical protein
MITQKAGLARLELDGENVQDVQDFPTQHTNRNQDHENSQDLPEAHSRPVRLEPSGYQAQDVQCGESENYHPKDVIDIALLAGVLQKRHHEEAEDLLCTNKRHVPRLDRANESGLDRTEQAHE